LYAAGQSADNLVLQGRSLLSTGDLTNATTRFAAAVAASPNHQTANALLAGTRLFALSYRQPFQDLLDRLGVGPTNRSVYQWSADLQRDTEGVIVPPNDFSAQELVSFVRTNVLAEVEAALGNAGKITDRNFVLALSSNETSVAGVVIDYGDIQMTRASCMQSRC
jgi:hypothetical protein